MKRTINTVIFVTALNMFYGCAAATGTLEASSEQKPQILQEQGNRQGNILAGVVQAGLVLLADEAVKRRINNPFLRAAVLATGCGLIRSYRMTAVKAFNGREDLAETTGYVSMVGALVGMLIRS